MNLSNLGRIVIIDDEYKQAEPLIQIFSKKNLPFLYFDGILNNLPSEPFNGIRFVFLDIQIGQFLAGASEKTKAATIIAILKKIISINNGPYFIFAWTRHPEIIKYIKDECIQNKITPLSVIDIEKSSLLKIDSSTNDVNYDLSEITKKLSSELKKIGAFKFYVEWENMVNDAMKEFVNNFSNFFAYDDNWSAKTKFLFYKLYKSYVDKNELNKDSEKIRCAIHLLNRSFIDVIENNTIDFSGRKDLSFFNIKKIDKPFFEETILNSIEQQSLSDRNILNNLYAISDDNNFYLLDKNVKPETMNYTFQSFIYNQKIITKINELSLEKLQSMEKALFKKIIKCIEQRVHNFKNLYTIMPDDNNYYILKETAEPEIALEKIQPFLLNRKIIAQINSSLFLTLSPKIKKSPGCLYKVKTNKKLLDLLIENHFDKELSKNILVELLLMIITPPCNIAQKNILLHRIIYGILIKAKDYKMRKKDHFLPIGPVWYSDDIYYIVFCFQTISSIDVKKIIDKNIIFAIKQDLLDEIQTKASNYINRFGNFMLK